MRFGSSHCYLSSHYGQGSPMGLGYRWLDPQISNFWFVLQIHAQCLQPVFRLRNRPSLDFIFSRPLHSNFFNKEADILRVLFPPVLWTNFGLVYSGESSFGAGVSCPLGCIYFHAHGPWRNKTHTHLCYFSQMSSLSTRIYLIFASSHLLKVVGWVWKIIAHPSFVWNGHSLLVSPGFYLVTLSFPRSCLSNDLCVILFLLCDNLLACDLP